MKFISKNSNLHIILQAGQPANPITQTPPVPALSVRFQNGQADIQDEAIVDKMMRHPAFNQDFIAVDEGGTDPFAYRRQDAEPQHITTEMKFGHPVGRNAPPVSAPASPELKKMIAEAAAALMEAQRPAMMKEAVEAALQILSDQKKARGIEPAPDAADEKDQEVASKPKARGTK